MIEVLQMENIDPLLKTSLNYGVNIQEMKHQTILPMFARMQV